MNWLNALLPFASVLIGAGITYWLNVWERRRSKIDEILYSALEAAAVANANHTEITHGGPVLRHANAEEQRQHDVSLAMEQRTELVRSIRSGRVALTRASVYVRALHRFAREPDPFGDADVREITMLIRAELRRRGRLFRTKGRNSRASLTT